MGAAPMAGRYTRVRSARGNAASLRHHAQLYCLEHSPRPVVHLTYLRASHTLTGSKDLVLCSLGNSFGEE